MGIRNKFCYMWSVAANTKVPVGMHKCCKNWEGSSSAMEPRILVEGFSKSVEMHSIRYKYFIGDGDSSVFANLKTKVSYGHRIQKIACTNHILKNYTKHLYKLSKMGDLAKHHIKHNHKHGTVDELREDLNNINNHSFGSHTNCKQYYCNGDETKTDYTVELKARGIFQKLACKQPTP
jgi:hypothetical protein